MRGKLTRKVIVLLLALAMVMIYMPALAFAEVKESDVAKIGDTGYQTLQGAFKAAGNNATITLLKDVEECCILNHSGRKTTLDLNGHSVTSKGEAFNIFGETLVIDDTSGGKGEIITNRGISLDGTHSNRAELVLNNGTIRSNGNAITLNRVNEVTVNGGKIIAGRFCMETQLWGDEKETDITINGGSLKAGSEVIYIEEEMYASVTVYGGKLEADGKIFNAYKLGSLVSVRVMNGFFIFKSSIGDVGVMAGGYCNKPVTQKLEHSYKCVETDESDANAGIDTTVYKYKILSGNTTKITQTVAIKFESVKDAASTLYHRVADKLQA